MPTITSPKSRYAYRLGVCFDTCKCLVCRRKREAEKDKSKAKDK